MIRASAGFVAMALLLSACATDREVAVRVPLSRLELPQAAPRMFGVGVASAGEAHLVLTPDQTVTAPDPDAPELEGNDAGVVRLDFQMQPNLGLAIKGHGDDGLGEVQVKWIARAPGPGRVALAVTAAYGAGGGDFLFTGFNDGAHTEFDQTAIDLALILGLNLDRDMMLYGGPYYHHTEFDGTYSAERGDDPDVDTTFDGQAELLGANAGLAWSFANWGRLLVEYSAAQVEAGSSSKLIGHAAGSAEFFFGKRTSRARPEAREPPVVVVPAQEPTDPP